ncbi:hypothetical protein K435DRAFT_807628 [Dendrothele bispora CBS 962.96]|uniref:Uncharacterized protein n=1 Tax=Dendrothele bispora (strain CBS 962.96) TaxID=1314807 RepID=A0A4S8L436_DENBC|nr:hypothetical protein K435DRAFT_807628 [Dendrothele bispora CBS 962.96]
MVIHVRIRLSAGDGDTTPQRSNSIVNSARRLRSEEGINIIDSTGVFGYNGSNGGSDFTLQERIERNRLFETVKEIRCPRDVGVSQGTVRNLERSRLKLATTDLMQDFKGTFFDGSLFSGIDETKDQRLPIVAEDVTVNGMFVFGSIQVTFDTSKNVKEIERIEMMSVDAAEVLLDITERREESEDEEVTESRELECVAGTELEDRAGPESGSTLDVCATAAICAFVGAETTELLAG